MKRGGLGSRLLVAVWGIPLLLGLTWLGGWWTVALVMAIGVLGQYEHYRLMRIRGKRPFIWLGLACGLVLAIAWEGGPAALPWILAGASLLAGFAGLLKGRSYADSMSTVVALVYAPLLAGFFLLVRSWEGGIDALPYEGRWLALCVWGAIWVGDTAAYAGGSWFGRHPLAPDISPGKTVEGFFFGLVGAVGFSLAWWGGGLARLDTALAVGIAAGLFGQVGDLVESRIKREAGVKDSSQLLPGHGGILDRFDSLFATAPMVAMYLAIRGYIL